MQINTEKFAFQLKIFIHLSVLLFITNSIVFKVLATLLFSTLVFTCVSAQNVSISVIASGGNYGENMEGISLSYTFGECSVKTLSITSMALTEGFQQGNANALIPSPIIDLKVYPNPIIKNKLYIDLPVRNNINSYIINIYSLTGQIIHTKQLLNLLYSITTDFDFAPYTKGLYMVKIQSPDGAFLKTYKIEKQ